MFNYIKVYKAWDIKIIMKASQWYEDYKYNLRIFKVKLLILFRSTIHCH